MTELSIIIPVFNEEENIIPILKEIQSSITENYEIIYVDDGSTDNTLLTIEHISKLNSNIKCISLSKNFGHQNAIIAGLEKAKGDFIITMDGDGQHPANLIPVLIYELKNGFDVVHTNRKKTQNINFFKKIATAIFYIFIDALSETKIKPNRSDFRAFSKKVLSSVLLFKERDLFLRGIFSWIGFKNTTIEFYAPERKFGKTKYTFSKMVRLALKATTSFSFKPLRIALMVGTIISFAAFGFGIFALLQYYRGNTIPGWASQIIATMFLGGTQLLAIGLLGEYIASLFTESKKRPLYLIDKTINID